MSTLIKKSLSLLVTLTLIPFFPVPAKADEPEKVYRRYASAYIANGDPEFVSYSYTNRMRRYKVNGVVTVGLRIEDIYSNDILNTDDFRYRVTVNGADVSGDLMGTQTFQWNSASLPDGTHYIGVKVFHHPSYNLSYIRPLPSILLVDNVGGPSLGAQQVPVLVLDTESTIGGASYYERSVLPSWVSFSGQRDHTSSQDPHPYQYVPPARDLPDPTILENTDNWFVENVNHTRMIWGDGTIPEFAQTKSGHIVVRGENTRADVTSEGAVTKDIRKDYRDGPRNDNSITPYSTFVPIPNGPGWMGVDINGRLYRFDQFGGVTTIAGQTIPAGSPVVPYDAGDPNFTTQEIINHQKVTIGNFQDGLLFDLPNDLAYDPLNSNIIYVADTNNQLIRRVDLGTVPATVTRFAGTADVKGDQDGPRLSAKFNRPYSIVAAPNGDLFVADRENFKIRKIDTSGNVTTLATFPNQKKPQVVRRMDTGDLVVGFPEQQEIDRVTQDGTISMIATNLPWEPQTWVWLDVDCHGDDPQWGSVGPKNWIYGVSSRGGLNGRSSIQRVNPATGVWEEWLPSFGGMWTSGRLSRAFADRFGHYTWPIAFDDEECKFITGGFGTHSPHIVRMAVPNDPPNNPTDDNQRGWGHLIRGSVPAFHWDARPGLTYLWGPRGYHRYGNRQLFDDIAEMSDQDLTTFIQTGMGSGTPRPEFTGNELRDIIFFIRTNSLYGETHDVRPGPNHPDVKKPVQSNINFVKESPSTIRVTWTTDEPTISRIRYGPREELGLATKVEDGFSTSHNMLLSDLENQHYHVMIISRDVAGNVTEFIGNSGPLPPVFDQHPQDRTVLVGDPVTFTANATGTPSPTFQWEQKLFGSQVWTPLVGATSLTLTIAPTTMADNKSMLRCVATNSNGSAFSTEADLRVLPLDSPPVITVHPKSLERYEGDAASYSVEAVGPPPLNYQWYLHGKIIPGATSSTYTIDPVSMDHQFSWFYCVVTNPFGNVQSNSASLTVHKNPNSPAFTKHPASQTVALGNTATFSVTAIGVNPKTYQWQSNPGSGWIDIAGATDTTYTTPATTLPMNGTLYRCVVTNAFGSATSNSALLTIDLTSGGKGSQPIILSKNDQILWIANPDSNSVSVVKTAPQMTKVAEINVGKKPRTLAFSPNESLVYVVCEDDGSLWVLDSITLMVTRKVQVGRGPFGVAVVRSNGRILISNQNDSTVMVLDPDLSVRSSIKVEKDPRAVVVTHDSSKAYVSHFISRGATGKVTEINLANSTVQRVISLVEDPGPDTTTSSRGIPNVLGTLAIHPTGDSVWYGGLKSNSRRGLFKDGLPLNFDNRLRGLAGLIKIANGSETFPDRIDTDDADTVTAVTFSPDGKYAYFLHQGSGALTTYDAVAAPAFDASEGDRVPFESRLKVGDAPQGMAVSSNGQKAYVMNFLSRNVAQLNLSDPKTPTLHSTLQVTSEPLPFLVALGKKMFYRSEAPKHSSRNYMACFSCHADNGHDGQVWDTTQFGEGLRNTIDLRGKGGMVDGPIHWSANFDEIQDFENDIVHSFGGTGLAQDGQDPHPPLSPLKNANRSQELDALAAYVASLTTTARSPYRNPDGTLTEPAKRGKELLFTPALKCVTCHTGSRFTDSRLTPDPKDFVFHDVGTLSAGSGKRLGSPLTGLDTPSLVGAWATAPYLHDGSAATIKDVLTTKNPQDKHGVTRGLSLAQLADLEAYINSIDGSLFDNSLIVEAGSDQSIPIAGVAQLAGNVTADGVPVPPDLVDIRWSKLAGPGDVTFGTPTTLDTEARFSAPGTYVLRLTVSENEIQVSDDVQITVGTGSSNNPTGNLNSVFRPLQGEQAVFGCGTGGGPFSAQIYNRRGTKLKEISGSQGPATWDGRVDGAYAASGMYIYMFQDLTEGGCKTKGKLVLIK